MDELPGPLEFLGEGIGKMTAGQLLSMKENGAPPEMRQNFFAMAMLNLSKDRIRSFLSKERAALGHCGKEAYLKFMERQCAVITALKLPEEGDYRIEVIDTWEMKRKTVKENVRGRVEIELPGKEDMAILAVKTGSNK